MRNIYDGVFKTLCQRFPYLITYVINEVFGANYPDGTIPIQYRTEHLEQYGQIIADAIMGMDDTLYHIECQSYSDKNMIIRMFQYDVAIALEDAMAKEKEVINFPKSCVIYVKDGTMERPQMEVKLPNGEKFFYSTQVVNAKDYSLEEIFQKKLLVFLPYYILRYEKNMPDQEVLVNEYANICIRLKNALNQINQPDIYEDILDLIYTMAEHIITDKNILENICTAMNINLSARNKVIDKKEGIEAITKLYQILKSLGRDSDIEKAMYDEKTRLQLFKEFNL